MPNKYEVSKVGTIGINELLLKKRNPALFLILISSCSDDELCQVFLQLNAWEMFKKDLLKLVMKPKLMSMVHPPDPWPTDEIYGSWSINQAGILDLTELIHKKDLAPPKYSFLPVRLGQAKETLPEVEPRLIHGIDVVRPSLEGAF